MQPKKNVFLVKNKENGDLNQYWYSNATIEFLVSECQAQGKKIAFLSTPSIYFSLTDTEIKSQSFCFDYDKKFGKDPNFVFYDFNKPEEFDSKFNDYFDMLMIDPPFITEEVWSKYAVTIKKLIQKDENGNMKGKILLSSIDENEKMLINLGLGVARKSFRPSIPNLVYQYSFFSNYESDALGQVNQEIGF